LSRNGYKLVKDDLNNGYWYSNADWDTSGNSYEKSFNDADTTVTWGDILTADGEQIETIEDMNKCKHLVNEVCCEGYSEHVADFPREEDCAQCVFFQKEDGVVNKYSEE